MSTVYLGYRVASWLSSSCRRKGICLFGLQLHPGEHWSVALNQLILGKREQAVQGNVIYSHLCFPSDPAWPQINVTVLLEWEASVPSNKSLVILWHWNVSAKYPGYCIMWRSSNLQISRLLTALLNTDREVFKASFLCVSSSQYGIMCSYATTIRIFLHRYHVIKVLMRCYCVYFTDTLSIHRTATLLAYNNNLQFDWERYLFQLHILKHVLKCMLVAYMMQAMLESSMFCCNFYHSFFILHFF